MTDQIIAMIPDYGLIVIFLVVALACLALPLPASMLVIAAGAFAAAEDLVWWQVLGVVFAAFVLGDQIAFRIAASVGPRLLAWLRAKPRLAPLLDRSEVLLDRRGQTAVLISHTILSPTCAYISYLCGAGGMTWRAFSVASTIGAAIWTAFYVGVGYVFAAQLTQVGAILSNFFGTIFALIVCYVSLAWLRKRWQLHVAEQTAALPE